MNNWNEFRRRRAEGRRLISDDYEILGFIASGTYGKVFKAQRGDRLVAIKKFKSDKPMEGTRPGVNTGITQSACREITLCRELNHVNIVGLDEVIVDPNQGSIYMVFEYAEHDLLQILHQHTLNNRLPLPDNLVKSLLWQLLNGVAYLHENWVIHRDLKPANILVQSNGTVKIADLGLARVYCRPTQPLVQTDKVVVTIWYRAPELLLGSKHYTPAIDIWAVGCILTELLTLKPLFKGEEIKEDGKSCMFQRNQVQKIIDVLGSFSTSTWPTLVHLPHYADLAMFKRKNNTLRQYLLQNSCLFHDSEGELGFDLLIKMLISDPERRITASEALKHRYFQGMAPFGPLMYPERKLDCNDRDILADLTGGSKNKLKSPDNNSSGKKIRILSRQAS